MKPADKWTDRKVQQYHSLKDDSLRGLAQRSMGHTSSTAHQKLKYAGLSFNERRKFTPHTVETATRVNHDEISDIISWLSLRSDSII